MITKKQMRQLKKAQLKGGFELQRVAIRLFDLDLASAMHLASAFKKGASIKELARLI
ncbi:MAG: hypothetical protein GY832_26010 [Chloroflexi bacterium]|nr:hypothetical protein [Chloroflexota bacterium]